MQLNEFCYMKLVEVIVYAICINSIYLLCGVLDIMLSFIAHSRKIVQYVKLVFLAFKLINQTLFEIRHYDNVELN